MGVFVLKNLYYKHKTHIIYSIKLKSKKIILLIILSIFNVSFLFTFKFVEKNFKPSVEALAISQANTYSITLIDEAIHKLPVAYKEYSELCNINKNTNGDIISVTTNTNVINNIKINLSEKIAQSVKNSHLKELGIPIGNLTGTYIFSGRGPKIPIKILTASSPDIHIDSKFEAAGVNQTKHKISIITNINIKIILPYETLTKKVTYETLLIETIIVGKVPDVYVSK